jgi:hypothetical protein
VAAGVSPPAPPSPPPSRSRPARKAAELDGELIRLCAEISACGREIDHVNITPGIPDAVLDAAAERWDVATDKIIDTPEGIRAKAGALGCSLDRHLRYGPGRALTDHAEEEDLLGWSLVHDILGKEADWS